MLVFLIASYIIFDIGLIVILVVLSYDSSISALSAALPSQIIKFMYNIRSSVIRPMTILRGKVLVVFFYNLRSMTLNQRALCLNARNSVLESVLGRFIVVKNLVIY